MVKQGFQIAQVDVYGRPMVVKGQTDASGKWVVTASLNHVFCWLSSFESPTDVAARFAWQFAFGWFRCHVGRGDFVVSSI